jgi:hypothetical protein
MAAEGLTTRQYFRQLRALDFADTLDHALKPDDGRKTLFDIQADVDAATAAHYAEPQFWSDRPWWDGMITRGRGFSRSVKET